MSTIDPLSGESGDRAVGFTSAFIAVFLACMVTGVVESHVQFSRFGRPTALFLTAFTSILICAAAIQVILLMMDASAPLTVIALSTTAGTVISLVLAQIVDTAQLHAEAHAVHQSPVVAPIAGLGFNAVGLVVWLAIAAGQAFVIQSSATG